MCKLTITKCVCGATMTIFHFPKTIPATPVLQPLPLGLINKVNAAVLTE
jgi:hypothetical protein